MAHTPIETLDSPNKPPSWEVWIQGKSLFVALAESPEWLCRWIVYYISGLAFFQILELMGKATVLVSLVTYLAESNARREERHNRAWNLIMEADRVSGDGGRGAAVMALFKDKVPLQGVSLRGATINNLMLPGADLNDAHFEGAFLTKPVFSGASLQNANFANSTLIEPDFTDTNLLGADFRSAKILWLIDRTPKLSNNTILAGATFLGANIQPDL